MSTVPKQSGCDGSIVVSYIGDVAVLTIDRGQNCLNPDFCDKLNKALDEIESNESAKALITTGVGKFYSNGIDLDWFRACTPEEKLNFRQKWSPIPQRILTFPIPTVAAINGHAFAGGAMLTMAHDYRVMRSDRGWICLSEVHVGVPFSSTGVSIIRSKVPPGDVLSNFAIMGKRFTGKEAKEAGLITAIAHKEEDLIPTALNIVQSTLPKQGIPRNNLSIIKTLVYADENTTQAQSKM